MAHANGWILDASIEQNRAIIWIKTIEGKILKLSDIYQPTFYILPNNEGSGSALFPIIVSGVYREESRMAAQIH